ncbi:MAG: porphobilinogen synthase [Thermoplasmata archaeon]|nr:porphobilinogen synthase [Thermoplasmata archaeon]
MPRPHPPARPGGGFPAKMRMRRLRRTSGLRELLAEHDLPVRRLVYPMFVRPGSGAPETIRSLPGIRRYAVDDAVRHAGDAHGQGIPAVLLFGLAHRKDPRGREARDPSGAVPRAIRGIKRLWPDLVVATDVCLCAYTSHGHCGVLKDGRVDNDATLPLLAEMAAVHAAAGADFVAPSAMMDHQVAALRHALDDQGFSGTGVLAYGAKFASAFYGPFRDAADSAPAFGDRREYQLDPRNGREADREIDLDVEEGADIVMVKPALPALDILARARQRHAIPLAAFQVSGEYAMLKAAGRAGALDEAAAVMESLTVIRRAGADLIVTYFAPDVARWARRSEER